MEKNFDNKFEHNFGETISFVMENRVKNPGIQGIETGFTDFDKLTKGFQPAELTILAGRPGIGKTSFWVNVVSHIIADPEMKVGVFLAKEEAEKVANMFLAVDSHVEIKHIESGRLSKKELNRVEKSAAGLGSSDIYITTPLFPYDSIGFQNLYYGILQYAQTYCVDIIIIDSLQYIDIDSVCEDDKYIEIVKALRELAITCQIPIVLISNLPAEIDKRENKRPTREDLREYGHIDLYSDTVLFLHRDDYYDWDSEKKGIVEIIVDSNMVRDTVELLWIPYCMTFANLDRGKS